MEKQLLCKEGAKTSETKPDRLTNRAGRTLNALIENKQSSYSSIKTLIGLKRFEYVMDRVIKEKRTIVQTSSQGRRYFW